MILDIFKKYIRKKSLLFSTVYHEYYTIKNTSLKGE